MALAGTPVENCKKVFFLINLNFTQNAFREGSSGLTCSLQGMNFDVETYIYPLYIIWVVAFVKRVTSEI